MIPDLINPGSGKGFYPGEELYDVSAECWWVQGTCGQNRPSAKALGAKSEMPKQQLEKEKQQGNEETFASQRRN
jgi:hypothetical protein